MKKIYAIAVFLIGTGLYAQNLSLVSLTDTVFSNPANILEDVHGKVQFQNNSSDTIYFKTKQAGPICGLTGTRQICVGLLCYPPSVIVTPDSFAVLPGVIDSSFTGHIITPADGFKGCCPLYYTFFDANNPSDSLQVTMWFCAANGISVEENMGVINRVYPNPASNYIDVAYTVNNSADARFRIINVVGQEVANESLDAAVNAKRIDISSLDSGVYFYSMEINGRVVEAKRLIVSK